MNLIAAIYWYQPKAEIWFMIVDDQGTYFSEPEAFQVDKNKTLISKTINKIFKDIEDFKDEGYKISVKYKTITTVAAGIRRSLAKPNPESKEVDSQIKSALKHSKLIKGSSFDKKKEIPAYQRKVLTELLAPLLGAKPKARIIDLWAIAYHENSFKNLVKKLWKIVKKATGVPLKRGDLKTKFEADYQQLLKDHPLKK